MATYGLSAQGDHVRSTIAEAKGLTVDRLKKVLRSENLQVSGIKSELQVRLIAHIQRCADAGEHDKVNRIRGSIRGVTGSYPNPYPSPYSTNTPTTSLSPQFASPTPRPPPPPIHNYQMSPYTPNTLNFKNSPFYTISQSLTRVQELKAREQTRDTARLTISLDVPTVELLQRDSNARIMVFCAIENLESRPLPCDISFPQHGEIKCNSDEVKANLKGLKNKPGTVKPVDITSFIRKKAGFVNSVELVYALTTKESRVVQKYFLVVNLVQRKPIDTLIGELKRGKFVSKERVIREMQSKASDPDIVATSSNMSLKDPVQMTRIQIPCRSISCRHNECFDAEAYLGLQEQAPTWTCPCCNRPAPWDNLIFDQYFDDILRSVPRSVDQVTVEPDGRWHIGDAQKTDSGSQANRDSDDDDSDGDDLIEISDFRQSAPREFIRTPSVLNSPSLPGPSSATSNKRKHSETIDLTLDSDEEEQPIRSAPGRNNTSASTPYMDYYNQSRPVEAPFRFHMPPPPSSSYTYNPDRF